MQRNFAYMHRSGCGKPAFYMEAKPLPGGRAPSSREVVLPNGEHPLPGSEFRCGSCGGRLFAAYSLGWKIDDFEAVARG